MKRLWKLLLQFFSRKFIVALLILGQIVFIALSITLLGDNYLAIYIVMTLIASVLALYIVNSDEDPAFKIAWLIPLLVVPPLTAFMYIFFKAQISLQLMKKHHIKIQQETKKEMELPDELLDRIGEQSESLKRYSKYMWDYGGFPVCENSKTKYYSSGEEVFPVIMEELEKAEKFIFLEFFIVQEGRMWGEILELLKRKVAEGVDVRVIYDGFGSQLSLPAGYHKKLQKAGIKTQVFLPFSPFLSTSQNNRDHRKIVVVDGNVAFTGGFNLADEYINEKERFGYWKDGGVRVEGDAVFNFTVMFLQMWQFLTQENCDISSFKAEYKKLEGTEGSYVLPFGDSPIDNEPVGKQTYMSILDGAKDYVYISTPYLVLGNEMMNAIRYATKSGVKVKLLLPGIPDKKYMKIIAQSKYRQLVEMGVELYEFTDGFVHEKSFISDDEIAVSGSVNVDYRSFYLHFECGVAMYRTHSVMDMKQNFEEMLSKSEHITLERCDKIPLRIRFFGACLNIFESLL